MSIKNDNKLILKISEFETSLGSMIAVADEKFLYLLEFIDRNILKKKIENFIFKYKAIIEEGITEPISQIKFELDEYFEGRLKNFKTPVTLFGSHFQKMVWEELIKIPYGQTRSYLEQAKAISMDKAYRAVANANGANNLYPL